MPDEFESGDPDVPAELLELHLILEEKNVPPEKFKEAFGDEVNN